MGMYPSILIVGQRDTGKSTLIKNILMHYRDVPVGAVVAPGNEEFFAGFAAEGSFHENALDIDCCMRKHISAVHQSRELTKDVWCWTLFPSTATHGNQLHSDSSFPPAATIVSHQSSARDVTRTEQSLYASEAT